MHPTMPLDHCFQSLICPECAAPLAPGTGALRCDQDHSYGVAADGSIALLPSTARAGRAGDTRAMVQARRTFLDRGYYRPILQAVTDRVALHLQQMLVPSAGPTHALLDAGCGEGSYLAGVTRDLRRRPGGTPVCAFGIDISAAAVSMAAARYGECAFIQGDLAARLPFADGALTAVQNIFAPRNAAEFARVIAPGGLLAIVIPLPEHQQELRAALPILSIEPDKRAHIVRQLGEAFTLQDERAVEYEIEVAVGHLRPLVLMSPNAWHLTEPDWELLETLEPASVTVAVTVLAFARSGAAGPT